MVYEDNQSLCFPEQRESQTKTAGPPSFKGHGGRDTMSPPGHCLCMSVWGLCAYWNQVGPDPGDASWFGVQPILRQRVVVGSGWCWNIGTKPISPHAGPVGWGGDRPTVVTLNLPAFVGLSQSLNVI
jgi:hypothetical protein